MGLKIVYHTESQGVKKISLTAMPFGVLLLQKEEKISIFNILLI